MKHCIDYFSGMDTERLGRGYSSVMLRYNAMRYQFALKYNPKMHTLVHICMQM